MHSNYPIPHCRPLKGSVGFAKMEHSFIFGQPVWGEYFARREQFTDELSRHVTAFRSVILTSPKGWGKKSMALHIGDLLVKKDYTIRTTYIELQRTTSIEDFCQSFVQAFSFDLRLFRNTYLSEIKSNLSFLLAKLSKLRVLRIP